MINIFKLYDMKLESTSGQKIHSWYFVMAQPKREPKNKQLLLERGLPRTVVGKTKDAMLQQDFLVTC